MKAVVLDASALLDALDVEKPGCMVALHDLGQTHALVAPALLASEVGQVIHRKRPQRFGRDERDRALLLEAALGPIQLASPEPAHWRIAAALATRHDLSFYDAEYLAVAIAQDAQLVTHDAALREAAAHELGPRRVSDLVSRRP